MKNQINGAIKSMRVNELLSLNEELANEYIQSLDNVSVLFETSDDLYTYGHSSQYTYVLTKKDETLHNQIKECKVLNPEYRNTIVEVLTEK
jgi:threonylcarbamoyladenosine tRNA methylthiotransferase MtaB